MTCFAVLVSSIFIFRNVVEKLFLYIFSIASLVCAAAWGARNESLALLLLSSSLSLSLYRPRRLPILAAAGLIAGAMWGVRLSYLPLVVALAALIYLTEDRELFNSRRYWSVCVFIAFASAGSIPTLIYMVDWKPFYLHNVIFHAELTNTYRGVGAISLRNIILGNYYQFFKIGPVVLAAIYLYRARLDEKTGLALLLLVSFAAAISPGMFFTQYYVSVHFIAVIWFLLSLRTADGTTRRALLFMTLVWISINAAGNVITPVSADTDGTRWADANRIWERLTWVHHDVSEQCDSRLFSYSGAFVVGSGFVLSRYTESGIFWRRLSGYVPDKFVNRVYGLDRYRLDPLGYIRSSGVNFILVGQYVDYEEDLLAWAAQEGFKTLEIGTFGEHVLRLLFNAGCLTQPAASLGSTRRGKASGSDATGNGSWEELG
jgi:hypothetical protein